MNMQELRAYLIRRYEIIECKYPNSFCPSALGVYYPAHFMCGKAQIMIKFGVDLSIIFHEIAHFERKTLRSSDYEELIADWTSKIMCNMLGIPQHVIFKEHMQEAHRRTPKVLLDKAKVIATGIAIRLMNSIEQLETRKEAA